MAIIRLDHVNFITHDMPATVSFYCNTIGLEQGKQLSIDTAQSVYFYIPGSKVAILHVGHAKADKNQPKFERLANLAIGNQGDFSTGAFDHFCLALDDNDNPFFLDRLNKENWSYQTVCHKDIELKQIWLLDPNGIRVELNFVKE
jgi:catechol 2,3-dioxygenase-like lactoylglutathione lyase family enzyme